MEMNSLLNCKTIEFYLRGINKLPDIWQEIIQNNSEYTIDGNEFVVELQNNRILLGRNQQATW